MGNDDPLLKADLHIHTVMSGHAYSTVREICAEAARLGLEMVAISDHGPAMPGGAHLYNFTNMVALPRLIDGVKVLRSAECNILDTDGRLNLPDDVLGRLDIVQAGLHPYTGYEGKTVEENTAAVVGAIRSGKVEIIVHPGNPTYPLDYAAVVKAAKENNVLLEVNNASFTLVRKGSEDNCSFIMTEAARIGGLLCVGSDAHDASRVGYFDTALELLSDAGYPLERLVNRNAASVLDYLRSRGKKEIRF